MCGSEGTVRAQRATECTFSRASKFSRVRLRKGRHIFSRWAEHRSLRQGKMCYSGGRRATSTPRRIGILLARSAQPMRAQLYPQIYRGVGVSPLPLPPSLSRGKYKDDLPNHTRARSTRGPRSKGRDTTHTYTPKRQQVSAAAMRFFIGPLICPRGVIGPGC
jgi:hypothetical protein